MKKMWIVVAAIAAMGAGCGDDEGEQGTGGSGGSGGMNGGTGGSGGGAGGTGGSATQAVTLTFDAVVDDETFVCGDTYTLGSNDTDFEIIDFRFFVQSVELKNADGDYVPVTLDDNVWQTDGTTLLDFEDGCGDLGTDETNEVVTGTVPPGEYDGIRFEMGVPFDANHANLATADSPLNLTAMHWNWQGGYKFLRIDSGNFSMSDWRMHLGSTGCDGDPVSGGTTACEASNRVSVEFDSFDPDDDVVTADLADLTDGAPVDENQMATPVGCMAGPGDSDCAPLFDNLGLPFAGADPSGDQVFFSVD